MPTSKIVVYIYKDLDKLSRQAADRFIQIADKAICAKKRFFVALSGGKTPKPMYELLKQPQYRNQIDWTKVYIFWSDERFIPYTDPESNYGLAKISLLDALPIPPENVFSIKTEKISAEESSDKYSQLITDLLGSSPCFDLILLGIGPDGHTASLFPNTEELRNPSGKLVVAVCNSPKPPTNRISFTWKLINNSKNIIFSVAGKDKVDAIQKILKGPYDPVRFPAQGVKPTKGNLIWLLDQQAASHLK